MHKLLFLAAVLAFSQAGCLGQAEAVVPREIPWTAVPPATQTLPPTWTAAVPLLPTSTQPPAATPEPPGCQAPAEDYTRVELNGNTLNRRTLSMLAHAQTLYGGEIDMSGYALTQGSYTDDVSASFGTHSGGGAVDLSVMRAGTYTVLWEDIDPLLQALRVAGFAAWLRDYGELYPDSPIHIHAIAIGDRELSPAAQEQLTGSAGYFRGYSGLPVPEGGFPTTDRFGGPILCQWMIALGYQDLR